MSQRPPVVVVQNPPIFLAFVVSLYARRTGSQYIIDSHTGALVGRKWHWTLPLHRLLSRGALATVVTNVGLLALLQGNRPESSGCILVLEDPPVQLGSGTTIVRPTTNAQHVVVVATYSDDEPIAALFEAASQLPDVRFSVTGDPRRLRASVRSRCPRNVNMTGWLSDEDYADLLHTANVVVALTTRDHTLLCGAFEALYAGQPLITSDCPALRRAIPQGAVFTRAEPPAICRAIAAALLHEGDLRAAMQRLAVTKRLEWNEAAHVLGELING